MKTRWIALILGSLTAGMVLILSLRWSIEAYVDGLSTPAVDRLVGRWEITWDRGSAFEQTLEVSADRVILRRYTAYLASDGQISFQDDEGCFHIGALEPSGATASGIYGRCAAEPDWVGAWEAKRLSD